MIDVIQTDDENSAFAKSENRKKEQGTRNKANPKSVLRIYIAQLVINEENKGNCELLKDIYTLLQNPYDEQPKFEKPYALRPE